MRANQPTFTCAIGQHNQYAGPTLPLPLPEGRGDILPLPLGEGRGEGDAHRQFNRLRIHGTSPARCPSMPPPLTNLFIREASPADVPSIIDARGADPEWGPADPRTGAYLEGTHHPRHALPPRVIYLARIGASLRSTNVKRCGSLPTARKTLPSLRSRRLRFFALNWARSGTSIDRLSSQG